MDFNIWIEKNKEYLDYSINTVINFLKKYENEFNYSIDNKLQNTLANYLYNTSSNIHDDI
tara:strand:+ start:502 stop:681 length:180 start_codon:yes stop_codon:yes gene_type:complete